MYITIVCFLKNTQNYTPSLLFSAVWKLRILYAKLLKCKYNFDINENEAQIQPYLLRYLFHSIRQPIFIQVWEKKSHHWEKWIVLRKKIQSTFSNHIQHKLWLHHYQPFSYSKINISLKYNQIIIQQSPREQKLLRLYFALACKKLI